MNLGIIQRRFGASDNTYTLTLYDKVDADRQLGDFRTVMRELPNRIHDSDDLLQSPRAGFAAYQTDPPDTNGYAEIAHPDLIAARRDASLGRWTDAIVHLRRVHSGQFHESQELTAALLEGDAYAACGHWAAARTTWRRAYLTSGSTLVDMIPFHDQWSSAMRRLIRYRDRSDAPRTTTACRDLPVPIGIVIRPRPAPTWRFVNSK